MRNFFLFYRLYRKCLQGNSKERIQKRKKIDEERQQIQIELKRKEILLAF